VISLAAALLLGLPLPNVDGPSPVAFGDIDLAAFADREARSCALTPDGALVGTDGGVLRLDHDGRVLAALRPQSGLPGSRVDAILPLGNRVWLGTEGGAALADGSLDGVLESHPGAPVRALLHDDEGILVGTWGEGVLRLPSPTTRGFEALISTVPLTGPARRITALAEWNGRTIATTAGGGAFELAGNELHRSDVTEPAAMIFAAQADGESLWLARLDGVHRVRHGRDSQWSRHDARDLHVGAQGVELATLGAGLVVRGQATSARRGPEALTTTLIRDLDARGDRRCLATSDGVWLANGSRWTHVLTEGPASGDISALAVEGDTRWVGSFDRGLMRWSGTGGWQDVAGVPAEVNAVAIVPGIPGAFAGTTEGLFHVRVGPADRITRVDRIGPKSGLPSEKVQTLTALDHGRLLIGTAHGIRVLDHGSLRTPSGARDWSVFAADQAADGTYWIGTTRGLVHLRGDGKWVHFSMLSGHLPDDWVTAIESDGDSIYVGTYGHGVVRFDAAEGARGRDAWRTERLGGGRVNIGGLRVDDGMLFAATMDGLLTQPVASDAAAERWTRRRDAGNGRDVTAVIPSHDGLWVATRRGLTRRKPTP
jgi:ligand-binding sensor domain-containing protein